MPLLVAALPVTPPLSPDKAPEGPLTHGSVRKVLGAAPAIPCQLPAPWELAPPWPLEGCRPSLLQAAGEPSYVADSCAPSPLLFPQPEPASPHPGTLPLGLGCGGDPDEAYHLLRASRRNERVELPSVPREPQSGHTRFVVVSDTHGRHNHLKPLPPGDVFIHCGDFTMTGDWEEVEEFAWWIQRLPYRVKVVVPGNHDLPFHPEYYDRAFEQRDPFPWKKVHKQKVSTQQAREVLAKHCTILEDQELVINGIRIYGSPWVPPINDWAFELDRGAPLQEVWARIPQGVDVLVTHGPPLGYGDRCPPGHVGDEDLLYAVERAAPRYHCFGHIHEGRGVTTNGQTLFINASVMDERYRVTEGPAVFDMANREPEVGPAVE
eukprot:EG_transcript_6464